jgi:two-component system response regulator VicR
MNKRILLVEDDKDHVELITIILSEDGFDVMECNPELLHANINLAEPCLILIDNWLGNYSGAQICKDLKANCSFGHIPIVLISASINLAVIANDCEADGYLEKPFDIDTLSEVVKGVLQITS